MPNLLPQSESRATRPSGLTAFTTCFRFYNRILPSTVQSDHMQKNSTKSSKAGTHVPNRDHHKRLVAKRKNAIDVKLEEEMQKMQRVTATVDGLALVELEQRAAEPQNDDLHLLVRKVLRRKRAEFQASIKGKDLNQLKLLLEARHLPQKWISNEIVSRLLSMPILKLARLPIDSSLAWTEALIAHFFSNRDLVKEMLKPLGRRQLAQLLQEPLKPSAEWIHESLAVKKSQKASKKNTRRFVLPHSDPTDWWREQS